MVALATAAIAVAVPAAATAQDAGPAYTDWNEALPGFPSNAQRSNRAECVNGSDRCIDRTIGEMYRRFHRVVPTCDDNNVFSITYLRVTEDIRTGVDEGFYDDENWLNRLDALFARTYFLTYDNHLAGRRELVPPAWRVAMEAGRDGTVEGIGNLLLSINAHVNRDFPFVLYQSGLVDADGRSRKPAHDSGNDRLRPLQAPTLAELSARFDASIDDYDVPGLTLDDEAFFDLLVSWRESAWQNAVRLAEAKNDAERRLVGQSIEEYALSQARSIYAGSVYGPGETTAARDALCAASGGQSSGYDRGSDVAHFRSATARARAKRVAGGDGTTFNGLTIAVGCPNGPGPCRGQVSAFKKRSDTFNAPQPFHLEAGERTRITVLPSGEIPGRDDRVRVRLKSLLGPRDAVVKRRTLRVE